MAGIVTVGDRAFQGASVSRPVRTCDGVFYFNKSLAGDRGCRRRQSFKKNSKKQPSKKRFSWTNFAYQGHADPLACDSLRAE